MVKLKGIKADFVIQLSDVYNDGESKAIFRNLCSHLFGKSETLIDTVEEKYIEIFHNYLEELKGGRPLQHIIGVADFYRLKFYVSPDVLIPRPETEELVYLIINKHKDKKVSILDICTGSSCIATALKKNLPLASVAALDISAEALEIAQKNVALNKVDVELKLDDALNLDASNYPFYDVIVSNPPYVTESEKPDMHKNVLEYEPHLALFVPDDDALKFYSSIASFAQKRLSPHGSLYFEINQYLYKETEDMLQSKGFKVLLVKDLNDNYRFAEAQFLG